VTDWRAELARYREGFWEKDDMSELWKRMALRPDPFMIPQPARDLWTIESEGIVSLILIMQRAPMPQ